MNSKKQNKNETDFYNLFHFEIYIVIYLVLQKYFWLLSEIR